jgi:hypothetical protein
MQDLSNLADGSLTASSMQPTSMVSDSSAAMTAPGSPSQAVDPADITSARLTPEHVIRNVSPAAQPREPNPWRAAGGTPWQDADEPESPGRAPGGPWQQA